MLPAACPVSGLWAQDPSRFSGSPQGETTTVMLSCNGVSGRGGVAVMAGVWTGDKAEAGAGWAEGVAEADGAEAEAEGGAEAGAGVVLERARVTLGGDCRVHP